MMTSNFANVKKIREAGLRPVCISRGKPRYYNGESYDLLAPYWWMLSKPRRDYDKAFRSILNKLDAKQCWDEIGGEDAVLLCYEKHNTWCHRRLIAEWFELKLKVVVPEFGHEREETMKYTLLPAREALEADEKSVTSLAEIVGGKHMNLTLWDVCVLPDLPSLLV